MANGIWDRLMTNKFRSAISAATRRSVSDAKECLVAVMEDRFTDLRYLIDTAADSPDGDTLEDGLDDLKQYLDAMYRDVENLHHSLDYGADY